MRCFITTVIASVLFGCSTQPYQPYFSTKIKTVPEKIGTSYWSLDSNSFFSLSLHAAPPGNGGCIKARVTIDSNGRIVNASVIKMIASPGFDTWIFSELPRLRYKPTKENADRIPIQTEMKWAFIRHTQVTKSPASAPILTTAAQQSDVNGQLVETKACYNALDLPSKN